MSFDDETTQQSPFRRPGWIAAAVVVGLLIIAAAVVWIVSSVSSSDDPEPAPQPSGSSTSAPAPSEGAEGGSSICGLDLVEMSGTLDKAPATTWEYAGTTPFPVSDEFGPADTTDSGIKMCFARTPEGAALAASVGVGYLMSPDTIQAWRESALAEGPIRDQVLSTPPTEGVSSEVRTEVTAFRLLSYDGDSARVDVGVTVTGSGNTAYLSIVMPLIWENGDWKVNYSQSDLTERPAQLPNLAGYIYWEG
ncbi:hypothetical protein JM654_04330 [Microbacterium oxydans]|nr:hypothetical protein [Microbacterium oxydans]MCB8043725.1 hypothetical protein [Microbacterium oxydans]